MTAWTTPGSWTGSPSESYFNTHIRDNMNHLYESIARSICGGRLTLATGVPVTTTDQTGKTTVYFTPYIGDRIGLYDGSSAWNVVTFTELSVVVPTTTVTPFDIFCYNNSGTATLETLNWTNDTTRATALTYQNGVLVKTGATTRRYLGTGRTTGVSGQTESSTSKRYLWNYYNRAKVGLKCFDSTDTWSYTTATWRASNNNTTEGTGRVGIVCGVVEDTIIANFSMLTYNNLGAQRSTGIGINSTSVNSAQSTGANIAGYATPADSRLVGYLAAGYNYLQCLEISVASGSTSWYGDGGGTVLQSGLTAEWAA